MAQLTNGLQDGKESEENTGPVFECLKKLFGNGNTLWEKEKQKTNDLLKDRLIKWKCTIA